MDNTELRHHCYAMGYSDDEVGAFYDGHEKGKADAIDECAKVVSSMVGICQSSCPIDCQWGTEESCVESWKIYLTEQLKEKKNE